MLQTLRKKKGQSVAEVATLVTIVIAAFISMQVYLKRGISGRWKAAIDDMGDQYDPQSAESDLKHILQQNISTTIRAINSTKGYWTKREDFTNTLETKSGFSGAGPY